jgi:hypothetical protein
LFKHLFFSLNFHLQVTNLILSPPSLPALLMAGLSIVKKIGSKQPNSRRFIILQQKNGDEKEGRW